LCKKKWLSITKTKRFDVTSSLQKMSSKHISVSAPLFHAEKLTVQDQDVFFMARKRSKIGIKVFNFNVAEQQYPAPATEMIHF